MAVSPVVADLEEVRVAGFYSMAEVSSWGFDTESCLEPVDVVDEGVLGSEGADPTLAAVIVCAQPLLKNCKGELVVVGKENHEVVVGGVGGLDPFGRGEGVAEC